MFPVRFLAALALLILSLTAKAQVPQPPEVAARQFLLVDLSSQQVLAEREADVQADPASGRWSKNACLWSRRCRSASEPGISARAIRP